MCVGIIGGVCGNKANYKIEAKKYGFAAKTFSGHERNFVKNLGSLDLMLIITNCVSHSAKNLAVRYAQNNDIPVKMLHAKGVSAIGHSLEDFVNEKR